METALFHFAEMLYIAVFAMGWFCRCCEDKCECSQCDSSDGPCEWEVVFSLISNGTCTGCDDINGTYIIPFDTSSSSNCDWFLLTTWSNLLCGGSPATDTGIRVRLVASDPDVLIQASALWDTSLVRFRDFVPAAGGTIDCKSIANKSLPHNLSSDGCSGAGSATCHITAL